MNALHVELNRLLGIMDDLRLKCPWDQKQTFESLRHLTLEETYELSDALLKKDVNQIEAELGDLLLHIVFYCKIGSEQDHFTLQSVIQRLCEKLIQRHPHIYGNVTVHSAEEVTSNWEKIKLKENGRLSKGLLSGVPDSMPALLKAYRMQEKAASVGFDWPELSRVWDKFYEELEEFKTELKHGNQKQKTEELGDLLFTLVNVARHAGINPIDALDSTNAKFKNRIAFIEKQLELQNQKMEDQPLDALETLWNQAKND